MAAPINLKITFRDVKLVIEKAQGDINKLIDGQLNQLCDNLGIDKESIDLRINKVPITDHHKDVKGYEFKTFIELKLHSLLT